MFYEAILPKKKRWKKLKLLLKLILCLWFFYVFFVRVS